MTWVELSWADANYFLIFNIDVNECSQIACHRRSTNSRNIYLYIYSEFWSKLKSWVHCIEIHYNLLSIMLSGDYRCSNSFAFYGESAGSDGTFILLLFYESYTRHALIHNALIQRPNIIFCKTGAVLQFIGEHHMLRVPLPAQYQRVVLYV